MPFRFFVHLYAILYGTAGYIGMPKDESCAYAFGTDATQSSAIVLFIGVDTHGWKSCCCCGSYFSQLRILFLSTLAFAVVSALKQCGLKCSWRHNSGGGGDESKFMASRSCRQFSVFACLRRRYCIAWATFIRASIKSTGTQQRLPRFKNRPRNEWCISSRISIVISYFSFGEFTLK